VQRHVFTITTSFSVPVSLIYLGLFCRYWRLKEAFVKISVLGWDLVCRDWSFTIAIGPAYQSIWWARIKRLEVFAFCAGWRALGQCIATSSLPIWHWRSRKKNSCDGCSYIYTYSFWFRIFFFLGILVTKEPFFPLYLRIVCLSSLNCHKFSHFWHGMCQASTARGHPKGSCSTVTRELSAE